MSRVKRIHLRNIIASKIQPECHFFKTKNNSFPQVCLPDCLSATLMNKQEFGGFYTLLDRHKTTPPLHPTFLHVPLDIVMLYKRVPLM